MKNPPVRVRFAPSPTGFLHIGGLRTALYNQLFAKHNGGVFILRIEDTDRNRLVENAAEKMCLALKACNVVPDEGMWVDDTGKLIQRGAFGSYLQSERKEKHLAYAKQLVQMDKAYYCFCTPERLEELRKTQELQRQPTMYDGHCRLIDHAEAQQRVDAGETHVIRLKLPKEGTVSIWDEIRDEVTFEWKLIDDQVIIKSDGFPTYHLAATCDDHDMQISHVIRAEEWISSTPKHQFIYQAFGWNVPKFAHLPLLLNSDHSKLSKRQGDVAVEDYLSKGYLPEALVNFVALCGWNPTGEREIYTKQELIDGFDIHKVNKSGAVVSFDKLKWMNSEYLRKLPTDTYLAYVRANAQLPDAPNDFLDACLLFVRDRLELPSDAPALVTPLVREHHDYSKASLAWKQQTEEEVKAVLIDAQSFIAQLDASIWNTESPRTKLEELIKDHIAERGWQNGAVLWPLRVALSGEEKSPSPFELLEVFGKERSLAHIADAIASLA